MNNGRENEDTIFTGNIEDLETDPISVPANDISNIAATLRAEQRNPTLKGDTITPADSVYINALCGNLGAPRVATFSIPPEESMERIRTLSDMTRLALQTGMAMASIPPEEICTERIDAQELGPETMRSPSPIAQTKLTEK